MRMLATLAVVCLAPIALTAQADLTGAGATHFPTVIGAVAIVYNVPGITKPLNLDGGTTYIFTDFLSSASKEWLAGPGRSKEVAWPIGLGGKGNDGVAGQVKQIPGSIGYVELAYARQTLTTGQASAAALDYAPLPKVLADRLVERLSTIRMAGAAATQ